MNRDRYLAGICLIGRPNRQDHVVGLEWLEPRVLLSAAPVVTTTGSALAYTEHDGAVVIDVGLSVSDADSTDLVSATIAISAYVSGQDVLSFTNQLGIAGSWDPDAGVLSLTGTALVADYQTALKSVKYTNTSHAPSTATRTVSFIASDDTAPSTPATRDVTVAGVNDAPTDLALSSETVAENAASGTTVGTLSTTDPDAGGTFTYTLVAGVGSTDNASFTLDGAALKTAAVFNYETKSSYSIRVRSTDQGDLWTEKALTITVTDVNEAPVVADQAFAVAENTALTTAVGTVVATDPDGQTLVYAITAGNTGNAFAIDAATGEITVAGTLNHETLAGYTLTVEVTDSGDLSDTATVTVAVNDVNEAPVVNDQGFDVDENSIAGTVVGTVLATDVDVGDTLTYAITAGNTGNAFAIDAQTGEITVANASALNPATMPVFSLTVEVTDSGDLTDTATVSIGQRLPIGGGASAVFRDRQGKLVKIALLGPGSGSVLLRGDRGWDVESITLTGTTARSWLRITTASYLATTTVKDITVNGSLGGLVGATTNVVGDIEISGALQQLTLGDVTGPSTLGINTDALSYAAPPQVRMTFGQVADCSIDTHGLAIGSLAATRWLNTDGADDTVSASGLGTLLVAGRRASLGHPAIAGDFEGSLRLTGFGASPRPTLFWARIAGTLADATWNVTGNVGFLGAGAAADDFTAVITGRIGVMNVPGNLSGTWTARSAGSLYVGGSLTGAVLTLTQEASPTSSAQTLGSLTVRKWIDGASVATAGHIGTLRAGAIRDSNVFAGVTQTRDLDSDGRADLPDPETDFDVLALAAIRTVVISGIRGEAAAFASSNIAAPNLGLIIIGTISDDNGGEAFGLAGRRLGSLRSASALTIPTAWPSYPCLGDFMVKVMSLRPAARG